ncbi:Imm61 family immunity protein [Mycobacterium sp. IS-3022]|uniref:Imm61 family immunity protein n=1 Tax=Mycobacterium sp. IS-3022 TaxID=1772277 RepID=UPI0009E8B449|nr:Imm61 family immunity protein [Mycobacterium sp. IS-3022]
MTSKLVLAQEVIDSAIDAEFDVRTADLSSDGRVTFTSGLGETRIMVGSEADGTLAVNQSDRLQPEYTVLRAPALATVERYLLLNFGPTARSRKRLPRVRIPADPDRTAPGFELSSTPDDERRLALVTGEGELVAETERDPVVGTIFLVNLSYLMAASIVDIVASYRSPSGIPLFENFVQHTNGR